MRKSFCVVLAIGIILYTVSIDCTAKEIHENAGTRGAQLLKIGVGAKAVGMGESYVAAADDVYAAYWNPAGLSHVETSQLGFMHNEWFEDIRYEFLGYVQPIRDLGTLAGSLSYVSMGELDKTDETGKEIGQFRPYDILLGLSFGKRLNNAISVGINAKFLREKIDVEKAQAFAVDFGGLYFVPNSSLILGVNVQHIGTKMKFVEESFSLPVNLKLGAAYRLIDGALTFAVDANRPADNNPNMGLGAEYKMMGIVNLRAGYRYTIGGNDLGTASGLRAGIGVEIKDYKFDYAFVPYGELGQAHRISLVASF
jgi:hypothetical protein